MNYKTLYVGLGNETIINGNLALNNSNLNEYHINRKQSAKKTENSISYIHISQNKSDLVNDEKIIKLVLNDKQKVIKIEKINDSYEEIINPFKQEISGIYPGKLLNRQKDVLELSEANVFLIVKQVLTKLNELNNDVKEKLLKVTNAEIANINNEILEWEYALDYCLAHLSRFGIEQNYNIESKRMEQTKSFRKWFKNWDDYFNYLENNPALYSEFIRCQKCCINLTHFSPSFSNETKTLIKK